MRESIPRVYPSEVARGTFIEENPTGRQTKIIIPTAAIATELRGLQP